MGSPSPSLPTPWVSPPSPSLQRLAQLPQALAKEREALAVSNHKLEKLDAMTLQLDKDNKALRSNAVRMATTMSLLSRTLAKYNQFLMESKQKDEQVPLFCVFFRLPKRRSKGPPPPPRALRCATCGQADVYCCLVARSGLLLGHRMYPVVQPLRLLILDIALRDPNVWWLASPPQPPVPVDPRLVSLCFMCAGQRLPLSCFIPVIHQ